MQIFTIYCTDKDNALDIRMTTRPDHLAYLQESGVTLHLGGPLLNDDGQPIGSLLIIEAESDKEAKEFAENDPYAKAGLFKFVEIKPYKFVAGSLLD